MRVAAIGCILAVTLLACRAFAGDFEEGMRSYKNKDYAAALTFLRRAADEGNASAQFNLGVMYAAGQGVERDDKQAVSWFIVVGADLAGRFVAAVTASLGDLVVRAKAH